MTGGLSEVVERREMDLSVVLVRFGACGRSFGRAISRYSCYLYTARDHGWVLEQLEQLEGRM